jgi:hypothetical protein
MADDTKALKHTFFLRGFFNRAEDITTWPISCLSSIAATRRLQVPPIIAKGSPGKKLVQPGENGLETLSPVGRSRIDWVVNLWSDLIVETPIVVEGYSVMPDERANSSASVNRVGSSVVLSPAINGHREQ